MNTLDAIDSEASRIEEGVKNVQRSMKASLGQIMERKDSYSQRAYSDLASDLSALKIGASIAVFQQEGGTYSLADEIVFQAVSDAGSPMGSGPMTNLLQFASSAIDDAFAVGRTTLDTDRQTVLRALRGVQIKAQFLISEGVTPHVAMNMSKGKLLTDSQFTRFDRIGRAWNSAIAARTAVRGALVKVYTESFLMALVHSGQDVAQIGDERFSITGSTPDLPTYEEIEDTAFHPNVTELVTRATD